MASGTRRGTIPGGMLLLLAACTGSGIWGSDSAEDSAGDDTDSGTAASWCGDALDTGAPAGPDCFSGTLACGDTITATTAGGASAFGTDDYGHLFCIADIAGRGYAGSERVYWIDPGGDVYVEARLEGCAPMAVSAMRWTNADTCPDPAGSVAACEGVEGDESMSVVFGGYPEANTWALVVDTADAEPAAFRLTIECG